MQAYYVYGVRRILGIQYGYEGLDPAFGHKPIELTPDKVDEHHLPSAARSSARRAASGTPR